VIVCAHPPLGQAIQYDTVKDLRFCLMTGICGDAGPMCSDAFARRVIRFIMAVKPIQPIVRKWQ
jgi:hypothetical protein